MALCEVGKFLLVGGRSPSAGGLDLLGGGMNPQGGVFLPLYGGRDLPEKNVQSL